MHPSRTEKRLPKGTQTKSYLEAFEGFGYPLCSGWVANVISRRFGLHLWGKVVSFCVSPGCIFRRGRICVVYFITVVSCVSEIHQTGFRNSASRHSCLGRLEARLSQLRPSALFSRFCINLQDFQYSQFARVYSSTRASSLFISLLS